MWTRKRKRWRARGSFLISVLVAGAGTCVPAARALVDGSAPSRLMVVQCGGGWLVSGVRGLASPDPLLNAIPWCAASQVMEDVEVIQHVPTAMEQIVVFQCH